LPIVGKPWEYTFYIDLVFDDYAKYRQSIKAIEKLTGELEILGEYMKGETIHED
jgi:prephenate dehydratase